MLKGGWVARRVACLLVAAMAAACTTGPANAEAFEQEVRAASVAWDTAFNTADTTRLMALYADDVISMPFERPEMNRTELEADFAGLFGDFRATHSTTIVGLQVSGDWSIERGHYRLTAEAKDGSGGFEEVGKHIVVRQRTDDGWKVVWEIWNLDAPVE